MRRERDRSGSEFGCAACVCLRVCGLTVSPSRASVTIYGVRPCSVHTLEEQLGLVPGTKSKIEDGSATGTSVTLGAAVADFR